MSESLVIVESPDGALLPTILGVNGVTIRTASGPDDDLSDPIVTFHNNVDGFLTVQIHKSGSGIMVAIEVID